MLRYCYNDFILIFSVSTRTKIQPLYKGDRSCTTLANFDCRKAFIGLGKYQPLPFPLLSPAPAPELDDTGTATDLDLNIIVFLDLISSSSSFVSTFLFFCNLNTDQIEADLLLPDTDGDGSFGSLSKPRKRDPERRKGIASDLARRNAGSPSIRLETLPTAPTPSDEKREKDDEEDDEEDVVAAVAFTLQGQGLTLAHSGQSMESCS